MTLKSDAKSEGKLTCGLPNDVRNLATKIEEELTCCLKLTSRIRILQNLRFNELLVTKVYNV